MFDSSFVVKLALIVMLKKAAKSLYTLKDGSAVVNVRNLGGRCSIDLLYEHNRDTPRA